MKQNVVMEDLGLQVHKIFIQLLQIIYIPTDPDLYIYKTPKTYTITNLNPITIDHIEPFGRYMNLRTLKYFDVHPLNVTNCEELCLGDKVIAFQTIDELLYF